MEAKEAVLVEADEVLGAKFPSEVGADPVALAAVEGTVPAAVVVAGVIVPNVPVDWRLNPGVVADVELEEAVAGVVAEEGCAGAVPVVVASEKPGAGCFGAPLAGAVVFVAKAKEVDGAEDVGAAAVEAVGAGIVAVADARENVFEAGVLAVVAVLARAGVEEEEEVCLAPKAGVVVAPPKEKPPVAGVLPLVPKLRLANKRKRSKLGTTPCADGRHFRSSGGKRVCRFKVGVSVQIHG